MQFPQASWRRQLLVAGGFLLLLLAALWSFSAGLGGQLIFDDEPNLQPWRGIGDIRTLANVLSFVSSSDFFPGRPLSLVSFLIDDQSWLPDIASLKRTNLAIHLVNACLVFWFCLLLLPRLLASRTPQAHAWLALLIAALWTLHPLQVSNVSYIIQRMNLLSTLLELAGLVIYLHGRAQLETAPRRALLLCSIGVGLFMPLAILAKENGLLLCAFVLLVEAYAFPGAAPRWWRGWKALFLWLPLLAFAGYCLVRYKGFTLDYPTRNFNSWERLLTQGPVLLDYLGKLLLPRLQGTGLYFDNFPVSRSLLHLPTLLAWLGLAGLMGLAWRTRRSLPLFSFGIAFFFCGHLMESTLLPLEMYFEHRNYLPQLGLWMSAAALLGLAHTDRLRRALAVAMLLILVVLVWQARQNAALWSNTTLQAAMWYHDNPGSLRTTMSYSNVLVKQRRFQDAADVLERSGALLPGYLNVATAQKFVNCYFQNRPTDFSDLPALARRAHYETASLEILEQMWEIAGSRQALDLPAAACRGASRDEIAAIYLALLDNPRFQGARFRATLFANLAAYAASQRDLNRAMRYYDSAFASEPSPLYAFEQAAMLASAGLPEDALQHLALARQSLTMRTRLHYPAMEANIQRLESALAREAARHD